MRVGHPIFLSPVIQPYIATPASPSSSFVSAMGHSRRFETLAYTAAVNFAVKIRLNVKSVVLTTVSLGRLMATADGFHLLGIFRRLIAIISSSRRLRLRRGTSLSSLILIRKLRRFTVILERWSTSGR